MGSKRIKQKISFFFFLFLLPFLFQSSCIRNKETIPVLRMYVWSNYFPESLLKKFSEKFHCKVELNYMSSNEELFAKIRAGAKGYDIIQPSDYMVRQLQKMHFLLPLDHTLLPNLIHLDERFRDVSYDPGQKFSVPFSWGTTGIAINTAKVRIQEKGNEISWKFLLESPFARKTSLLDDMREVFGLMLRWKGFSINTKEASTLQTMKKEIERTKKSVLLFTSEPRALLLKEELYLAHIFSYDAALVHKEKKEIKYYFPKEGGITWTDNLSISQSSKNPQLAHQFINFILEPEHALVLIRENSLASPNKTARLRLNPEEQNNPYLYPPAKILEKMEYVEDLGETLPTLNQLWTELKS